MIIQIYPIRLEKLDDIIFYYVKVHAAYIYEQTCIETILRILATACLLSPICITVGRVVIIFASSTGTTPHCLLVMLNGVLFVKVEAEHGAFGCVACYSLELAVHFEQKVQLRKIIERELLRAVRRRVNIVKLEGQGDWRPGRQKGVNEGLMGHGVVTLQCGKGPLQLLHLVVGVDAPEIIAC